MSEEKTQQPVVIYAEMTPNPAAMKFVADFPLIREEGAIAEYSGPEEAQGSSPLAEALFQFPFITNVFITANFVSVTKNDSVEWDMINLELREFIRDFLAEGKPAVTKLPEEIQGNTQESGPTATPAEDAPSASEHDDQIKELLDQYVRPAVEGDGGAIHFHSFQNGVVTVTLRGACSGCPSSTVTLKNGIEALLKEELPEVTQVEALEL